MSALASIASKVSEFRRNVSLRKSFLLHLLAAVVAASLLSWATLFGLSRCLQYIYDQSYGGCNSYLYDSESGKLVPAAEEDLSRDGEQFVPVFLPSQDGRGREVVVDELRAENSPFVIYLVSPSFSLEPLQSTYLGPGQMKEAMDEFYEKGWDTFTEWLRENRESPEAHVYIDALNGVPLSADEAQSMFAIAFGNALAAPFDVWSTSMYTEEDLAARSFIETLSSLLIILWFAGSFLIAGNRFYKTRLATPVALLEGSAEAIAQEDLDCEVVYDRNDELGKLVSSFEVMRHSLEKSQRKLWQTAEDRRQLNAAFAHDLRTPLVVLRGRVELLQQQAESGMLDKKELQSSCAVLLKHVQRLEDYVAVMSHVQKLEDREISRKKVALQDLEAALRELACTLASDTVSIEVVVDKEAFGEVALDQVEDGNGERLLALDLPLVLEVAENLLSNAVRYAESEVRVEVSLSDSSDILVLQIVDDGVGFGEEALDHAVEPFYRGVSDEGASKTDATSSHFGVGLSISRQLCEKHDGSLVLSNRRPRGAVVEAIFSLNM